MKNETSGLAGVVVGETAICTVGHVGVGLTYRGYSIVDLASLSSFEEVAFLLIEGHLPTLTELEAFIKKLVQGQTLPQPIIECLKVLPKTAHPMDVLRTAVSALGTIEPENADNTEKNIAIRLIPFCISALMVWHHYHTQTFFSHGTITHEKTIAGHFLKSLQGNVNVEFQKALDAALVLYAEHEFNASTFAARVTASTLSDFYSCIVSAIGTLRGPLHGGANEAAMALILQFKNSKDVVDGIKYMLHEKKLIMGFGHRVYKTSDPRTPIIKNWAKHLSQNAKDPELFIIAEQIEAIMWDEKKLFPNLDFYSALVFHYLGIPISFFTPLFVISRLSGWSAHIIEQRQNNRLIRPNAKYIGIEEREFIPIEKRK